MSNSDPSFPSQNPVQRSAANLKDTPADLLQLMQVAEAAAKSREGDCLALLKLLRILDELHSEIRDTLFREALPDNRQRLYRLLKDMEQEGGWPYIRRMKITALLEHFKEDAEDAEESSDRPNNPKTE